jgi:hypothetical protein
MKTALHGRRAALLALLAVLAAGPAQAQAHTTECGKAAGIDKARCERHEKMAVQCGPLKGEAHHACDRDFLLANPLACTALPAAEQPRCQAELDAFKACESKAGRAFMACVRDMAKESPLGVH